MTISKINVKLAILLGLSLLLMPFANALTVNDFFQNFYNLIENQYAFYTMMFLVTFIFLFSIFFALSKNMPFFKASGGNVNSTGKIFALSLSAISTLSLFSYAQGRGGASYASRFFTNRIGSWGPWGWILLALLILAVVLFALKKKGKGILGEGDFDANLKKLTALVWVISFILVMYGSISKNKTSTNIGAVLFVIALILTILTGGFKFGEKGEESKTQHPPPPGRGIIYGRVIDKNTKKLIEGVSVGYTGAMDTTDNDGRYAIEVSVGNHIIYARKAGYENYASPVQIPVADRARVEHNFEMEPVTAEKGKISGIVVDAQHPDRGIKAEVYLMQIRNNYPAQIKRGICGDDGKFEITEIPLPSDDLVVYAKRGNAEAYHNYPFEQIKLDLRHPERTDVVVSLFATGTISGKVVDWNAYEERKQEVGIVGAKVYLATQHNNKIYILRNMGAKLSDSEGKFKFEPLNLPMKNILVYAEKDRIVGVHKISGKPSNLINLDINHREEVDVVVPLKREAPTPIPAVTAKLEEAKEKKVVKKLKKVKKKIAKVEKTAEKNIRSGKAKASVRWADKEELKILRSFIDDIDEEIKMLREIFEGIYGKNYERNLYDCILKENPNFKSDFALIKKIYNARSLGGIKFLGRDERYTYGEVFGIAETILASLSLLIEERTKKLKAIK